MGESPHTATNRVEEEHPLYRHPGEGRDPEGRGEGESPPTT